MPKQASAVQPPSPRPVTLGSAPRPSVGALDRSMALVCRGMFGESSELLRVGRFELVTTLGRGGMGIAYEAFDALRGEHVALKMLHDSGATSQYLLKREFRSLARLRHPNLVRLHELFVERELSYFTMERIRGADFVSYVRGKLALGELPDPARLHAAFVQLCAGVRALHQAGKLHRDLKPANVLVDTAGRVVLLDFGLVHDVREGGASAEGTPAFMAPEQLRGEASEASDWYSVGCVLHAALYGLAPSLGEPHAALPTRRMYGAAVGALLQARCAALLSADPTQRLHAGSLPAARGAPSSESPAHALCDPTFVGREPEQTLLERALEQSRSAPLLVSLQGESGIGKTALMERFARRAQLQLGALVLRGRCYERESVAYKAFDDIIDDLTRHLLSLSPARARAVRPPDCNALIDLFPVLGRVSALERLPAHNVREPAEERTRAFAALKQLLHNLVCERPLVLCVDDMQWSDPDSDLLLAALLDDADAPALLVVATERIASTHAGQQQQHPAGELARVVLTLSPLAPHHTRALAQSFFPALDGDHPVVQRIVHEASGSPLLTRTLSRWAFDHQHSDVSSPQATVDALIGTRLDTLSSQQRLVLQLIVLAGRPTASSVIARAAQLQGELEACLAALCSAHLIQQLQRAGEELLEPDHLSVREAVLARTSGAERAALHLRLAEVLAQTEGVLAAALVEQYVGAGLPSQAARHARRAAEAALSTFAFSSAISSYERSLALGDWSLEEQQSLRRELARALEHAGRWRDAVAVYRCAAASAVDPLAAAHLEQRAALHLMNGGHYREGERLLRAGYKTLGMPWPRSRLLLWGHVLARSCAWRLGLPALRASAPNDALHRARADFLADAGRALEEHDMLRAVHNALLCFEQSERVRDPRYPARALAGRGFMRGAALGAGGSALGLSELQAACARAEQLQDDVGLVDIERQLASGYFLAGRPREALAVADRCLGRLRTLPQRREKLDTAMLVVGLVLFELGELREFERRWSTYARESRAHSELTRCWIESHPARLATQLAAHARGASEHALAKQSGLVKLHPNYLLLQWAHISNVVSHALYWGPSASALELVDRGWPRLTRSVYPVLRDEALLLRLRAWLEAACALPTGARRAQLLRRAESAACALERRGSDRVRAQLLVSRAAIEQLAGRTDLAVAQLELALVRCDVSGQKLLAESARYCRGVLVCGDQGRADRSAATHALSSEGIVSPHHWIAWSAPGFRTLLEASS